MARRYEIFCPRIYVDPQKKRSPKFPPRDSNPTGPRIPPRHAPLFTHSVSLVAISFGLARTNQLQPSAGEASDNDVPVYLAGLADADRLSFCRVS